jgi:hypothetical protein
MSPPPEPRIGDAERDAAIQALGEHFAAGRLTKDEYDERSEAALRARTDSDLRPLFVDLPRTGARAPGTGGPTPHAPRRPGLRYAPVLPLMAFVVVMVAVTSRAWWLLFVVAWLLCWGPRRHWR